MATPRANTPILKEVDPATKPQWKRHMKWDNTRDVIETMGVGQGFEFEPTDAKELRVIRVMVSEYGSKTGKAFSVRKTGENTYMLVRTK